MVAIAAVAILLGGCNEGAQSTGSQAVCPGAVADDNPFASEPPIFIASGLRQKNWGPIGSCHNAAFCDVLVSQNRLKMAAWWRANRGGATSTGELVRNAEAAGLRVAYTLSGDVAFLEQCSKAKRATTLYWRWSGKNSGGLHAITFLGFRGGHAYVADNNSPTKTFKLTRERFLRLWRTAGGDAVTYIGTPNTPRPWTLPVQQKGP